MFKTVNITTLLISVVIIMLCGLSTIVGTSLYQIQKIRGQSAQEEKAVRGIRNTLDARFHTVQIQQFLTDASLTHEMDGVKEAKENLDEAAKKLKDLKHDFPLLASITEELIAGSEKLNATGVEMVDAYIKNGLDAGNAIMKRPETGLDARSDEISKKLDTLVKNFDESVEKSIHDVEKFETNATVWISGVSITLFVLVAIALSLVYKRISPLLTMAKTLKNKSERLAESSNSLSQVSTNLSESGVQESSAVQQTAAAIEQISAMLQKSAESAHKLDISSNESSKAACHGKNSMERVNENIQEIKSTVMNIMNKIRESNHRISDSVRIINEIKVKTKVIDDIVFQTKLLAFNASVEAARAGEAGKGFAVVADEVSKLAQMSGRAAKEIFDLIEKSIQQVDQVVTDTRTGVETLIEHGTSKITTSGTVVLESNQAFIEIVENVDRVKTQIESITAAVREQNSGVQEISKAITKLEQIAQGNLQYINQSDQLSQSLQKESEELISISQELNQLIQGRVMPKLPLAA